MAEALEGYAAQRGHARVPAAAVFEGKRLGAWVNQQRTLYKQGRLNPQRAARLEAIPGWVWDALTEEWERSFRMLQEYAAREGHSRVPQGHRVDGFGLGAWATGQRAAYRAGKLAPDRAARLEALPGWEWSPHRGPRPARTED